MSNSRYIILLGSKMDKSVCLEIQQKNKFPERIQILSGKISLLESCSVIAKAQFLISNETGLVHIAAALRVPVVCISNANHLYRFHPYPQEMGLTIRYVYPQKVDALIKKSKSQALKKYYRHSSLHVDSISSAKVIEVVKTLHKLKN